MCRDAIGDKDAISEGMFGGGTLKLSSLLQLNSTGLGGKMGALDSDPSISPKISSAFDS